MFLFSHTIGANAKVAGQKKCGDSRSSKKIWNQFVAELKKQRKKFLNLVFEINLEKFELKNGTPKLEKSELMIWEDFVRHLNCMGHLN